MKVIAPAASLSAGKANGQAAGAVTAPTALASTGFAEQQIVLFGSLLVLSGLGGLVLARRGRASA
ncbi:hypothetical protein FNH21_11350 [Arthrobacter sp. KR32]|uniref:Gram-positive cocci surface proteins LPxTG domain-containing protein n=1 Tax=Arthrobacter bussei TaxID=2594179 RepID=A0A7X1TP61_9MICC|nr:hypothetical protein [Arthrobacter bussei]